MLGVLALAMPALAQQQTGRIDATLVDKQSGVMPGVASPASSGLGLPDFQPLFK